MQKNYDTQQVATIRTAIEAGRRAMRHGEPSARIFASAFFRAGGLQLPGEELARETRRRMESLIMVSLGGRSISMHEGPGIRAAISRELSRIHDEVGRFQAMQQPHLLGYRAVLDGVADADLCRRYTAVDAFGMGAGVVPAHEIVVLPPCCDNISWQPLYEEE